VKTGVVIPNFGPDVSPSWMKEWAVRAEQAGFGVVTVADHLACTQDVHAKYVGPYYEPFTTLAWLAGATERIELGTSAIVLAHRHPLVTARMIANVDQFSGGRFILGVAIGWSEQEYQALNTPFRRRGRLTEEYLTVLNAMWDSREEFVSFEGETISLREVFRGPAPLRRPPIWIGANAPSAIHRTARQGDAWHPVVYSLDWLEREGMPMYRAAMQAQGRETAELAARVKVFLTDEPLDDDKRRCGEGTIEQIGSDLRRLAAVGATTVLFDTDDQRVRFDPRSIDDHWRVLELIQAQVMDMATGTLRPPYQLEPLSA
jgi:probable F420-dependent oxidoreductase